MAHLVAPQSSKPTLPVFYNVDAVVGAAPATNNREDVLLVQFAFAAMAANPLPGASKEFYNAISAVKPTGTIDQATVWAIKATQIEVKKSQPGTVVDGRVSPATGGYGYGGGGLFTITHINESLQHRYLDHWPRIDKIPGCPLEIKQMVVRTVQGT